MASEHPMIKEFFLLLLVVGVVGGVSWYGHGHNVHAQSPSYYQQQAVWMYSGAPSGACNSYGLAVDTTTSNLWTCLSGTWKQIGAAKPTLYGTTGSIGGGLLTVGSCASGTATVTGATIGMTVTTPTPTDGTNMASLGAGTYGVVTASNTVTVNVCALIALTPTAKTYNVGVIP